MLLCIVFLKISFYTVPCLKRLYITNSFWFVKTGFD